MISYGKLCIYIIHPRTKYGYYILDISTKLILTVFQNEMYIILYSKLINNKKNDETTPKTILRIKA